jgi:TonB family protein
LRSWPRNPYIGAVTDRDRNTDPRSPVQPEPSNLPYLLLALVVAGGIWTFGQYRREDPSQGPRSSDERANNLGSTETPRTMPGLFSSDDYPPEALDRGEQGTVNVRVAVNTSGRVSACTVLQSSGSQALDHAACKIITARARFRPAQDAAGRAIESSTTQKIVWRIAE